MTGDRLIRAATVAAVLLVAAIAAVVSYQHLYHLAITHGETRLDAALLPGWPAAAFLMNAEGSISFGRKSRRTHTEPAVTTSVAADAESAARTALAASVAAGNPISQRQLMTRFGLTRIAERKVRQAVLAGSNGHSEGR